MRICVLGTYPLNGAGPKTGTQHIAETLAGQGHEVLYVTAQASWVALLFPGHRSRYLATFRTRTSGERLEEVTPVKLLPSSLLIGLERTLLHKLAFWLSTLERTRGRELETGHFDLCIFSTGMSMTLLRRIRARNYIYRVNDVLAGFKSIPRSLVEFERQVLSRQSIAKVCPVNRQIAERLQSEYPHLNVEVVPNGLDVALFRNAEPDPALWPNRTNNVIYVGAFDWWTDLDLILATAERLPDHSFHLFGSGNNPIPRLRQPNVHLHGPLRHQDIAGKMKGCSVGLIPSGPQNAGRMVEKPIKFYEYLAAGLGVAATGFAGRELEPFAALGDGPDQFAAAIREAKSLPARFGPRIQETLALLDWDRLVRQMLNGIE